MKKNNIYKPNIKKIRDILTHPQIYTVFSEQNIVFIKRSIDLMAGHLKGRVRALKEAEINEIQRLIIFLSNTIMEKPITPILKDLINEFIILAASWNENIAKRMEIRNMIYTLRRLIDIHLSFKELIEMSKKIIKKSEAILKFSPPAFEISRHYLEAIEKLNNKKVSVKKTKKANAKKKNT